ncbi:two-component regulator propeller domain-containing protein, partial [Barnesiella intestinihominis]
MNIQTIYVDNDKHSIWIGTHGNGLLIYDIPNRSLSLKADLSKYKVHSIYSINKDNEGNIWLGTDNGLFRMDIKTN